MKKLSLSLFILVLAATPLPIVPVRSDSSGYFALVKAYWGTGQPIEVSPGDVATLTIVLRYGVTVSFRSLEADLSLPAGFEAIGESNASVYFAPTVSQGELSLVELRFPLLITLDVTAGNYTADLDLEYYISSRPNEIIRYEDQLDVPFEVTGKPSISARVLNDYVHEGKQQVMVELTNDGDAPASNLEITEVYSSSASAELEESGLLGNLNPEDKAIVPLSLFVPTGMKGRIVPLTIGASYMGPRNVVYLFSKALQLPVKPSDPMPSLELSLDARELNIGESNKIYFDLVNHDSQIVSEIRLTLLPDNFLKIFGPTILYVDKLSPKESEHIEAEIYVPSTTMAQTATLTLMITYFDEDSLTSQSETYNINMLLRGLIELSLTDYVVIPDTPRPENPFSVTITVTNIGTSAAYATSAIPRLENIPLGTFGPKSTYIGNIEPNLPTTFTINLQIENTTEASIVLPVTLGYMDNLRSEHNITFNIPVTVDQTSEPNQPSQERPGISLFGLPGLELIIIASVIIVVVVVLWKWKK